MANNNNGKLVGAKIFLKDIDTTETIGETVILTHNPTNRIFTASGKTLPGKLPDRIMVLMVTDSSMDYNLCAVKNIGNDNERIVEFGIIKSDSKKNERGAPRFKIAAPAIVRELNDFMGLKKTKNVFLVNIKDMSSTGIMFSAPINQFEIHDEALLEVNKLRPNTSLWVKVVRKQKREGFTEEIACKIIKMISKNA